MLSKSSDTQSFQEVLADLRTTRIGTGLPSPAEILHGRNLTTREQAEIDIQAICSTLQERQLKMKLDHDSSRRVKRARPLVIRERCYVLGPNDEWIDAFVIGTTDNDRGYKVEVEANGAQLTRNRSHIRPRTPDIPMIHASFLQQNSVLSGNPNERNAPKSENSVISGLKQLVLTSPKTVLSGKCKGSIKPATTSQVLVIESDRRIQPSRQAKKTRFGDDPVTSTLRVPPRRQPGRDTSTRNRRNYKLDACDPDLPIPIKQTLANERHSSDLGEPQPTTSDSQTASSQPVSETTTSESSVSLPSSPSGSSSTESTSTSGTETSSTETSSSETSSESSTQPSSNASSPETTTSASSSRSTSPELLELEHSFSSLLAGTRERQGHAVMRSQMGNLRDQQQRITILKQVAMQQQNQLRPVSVPPAADMPLPPYPQRRPSDQGSRLQVQAENAIETAKRKNSSDSETGDRLQDIPEEPPRRRIGPSHVKELAKLFTPSSDEENQSCVNTRTRRKRLFEPKEKEEEGSEKKYQKL